MLRGVPSSPSPQSMRLLQEGDGLKQHDDGGVLLPIQYLRGVAALMVVWHHAAGMVPWMADLFRPRWGALGVDVFFVLSGFIMVVATHRRPVTPWTFMRQRIVRVVPLYWLLTLVLVAAALALPGQFRSVVVDPAHVLKSLLFIPHDAPGAPGELAPVLVPGWTLNYEMFFYACFALTLGRLRWLVVLFAGLATIGWLLQPATAAARFYTSALLLEFVAGALLARAWIAAGAPVPAWARWRSRVGLALGDASYSVYLTHLFVLGALRAAWNPLPHTVPVAVAYVVTGVVLSVLVGWVVYRRVERPLLQTLKPGARSAGSGWRLRMTWPLRLSPRG